MAKKKYKIYKFWGANWSDKPDYWVVGLWAVIVIITFPLWMWVYLIYMVLEIIGIVVSKKKIKVIEYEKDEENYY